MPAFDLHRDPRRHRHRRQRRSRRASTSGGRSPSARRARRRRSSSSTSAPAASQPGGEQGSAAKWAHAAMALAIRALGPTAMRARARPRAVFEIAERVMSEGDAREAAPSARPAPRTTRARCCAPGSRRSASTSVESATCVAQMQDGGFSPRRSLPARPARPRAPAARRRRRPPSRRPAGARSVELGAALFDACDPGHPLRAVGGLHRREQRQARASATASRRGSRSWRTAIGAMHGVTRTIEQIRERGVAGFDDRGDRHRPPTSTGGSRRSPTSRSPTTRGWRSACRAFRPPSRRSPRALRPDPRVRAGSGRRRRRVDRAGDGDPPRRQLPHRAGGLCGPAQRQSDARADGAAGRRIVLLRVAASFCHQAARQMRPSPSSGIASERIVRWDRGVDTERFDPALRGAHSLGGDGLSVLYAGRISKEKNIDLLADAFELAHAQDPRLHLVLAGGGPEQPRLAARRASAPASSAGSRGRSWPPPTRAPTSSASRARPTPLARSCSRRRRAASRCSRSMPADRAS